MLGEWGRRIWYLLNRSRIERELEIEMAAHREMMGEPRGFGNVLRLREESRAVWGWGWLDRAVQDVRHAARVLRRTPAFAITAVLILSGGIGLNLTFFQLLNVTALQPPAVEDPSTLVRFWRRGRHFASSGMPFPATQFIRQHNSVLSAVLTRVHGSVDWDGDAASKIAVAFVSANWFDELGYSASLGRVFTESLDEQADAPPVVVVSDQFWRTRLGADLQIVGSSLRLNDRAVTLAGVAPPDFPDIDLQNPQMWLLIHQIDYIDPGTAFKQSWNDNNTGFYARLREGISEQAAADGLAPTIAAMAQAHPREFQADEWLEPATGDERFIYWRERRDLMTLAALVGGLMLLVLCVASANLGNLVLSHAIGRLRELSVRAALGATRGRILRHILLECGLLAAAGALGGIALGYTSVRVLAAIVELPPFLDFTPDRRLFAAAFAAAFVAMLVFGLAPAWMVSRRDLIHALKDGGQQASSGLARARLRLTLVAAQVIGCCALLVVAGAMTRGLQRLLFAHPGFSFDRVALLDASLARTGMTPDVARAYWAEVARAMIGNPEVQQVALAYPAPLGGGVSESRYGADSGPLTITNMRVDPAFFSVLEIPLLAGRNFGPNEDPTAVIISRRVAMTMYGTLDVVGNGYPRSQPARTIVGVAGDALVAELRASNTGEEYGPLTRDGHQAAVLLAKARTDPRRLLTPMRAAARAADSRVLPETRLLRGEYEQRLRAPQLTSTIAALIAALVLTLACLGIFGVIAYAVKLRAKEIGIRRALGADTPRVIAVLLRQLAWPVIIGMVIGTGVGLLASRLLGRQPFYLAVPDATAPTAALLVFAVTALTAAVVPASRAMRTDPVQALRHE